MISTSSSINSFDYFHLLITFSNSYIFLSLLSTFSSPPLLPLVLYSSPSPSFSTFLPHPNYSTSSFLKTATENWVTVPTNSILTIHKQTVLIHPILDQYYNHAPSYVRSSGFGVSKGLVGDLSPPATTIGEQPERAEEERDAEDEEAGRLMVENRRGRGKENEPFSLATRNRV